VERTAASVGSMLAAGGGGAAELQAALGTAAGLRPRLDAAVAAAVREYMREFGRRVGGAGELKLTLVVNWGEAAEAAAKEGAGCAEAAPHGSVLGSVGCHIAPLPPLPDPPIRAEVRGAPRANAAAKDSSWVADRAPLEALMRSAEVGPVNELLLATESGELLEGSQTNFYAIVDGAVHTAGEGILAGTVRRLLLEVCEREGTPVVLSPPRLVDAGRWEGALISSTSRLLLPVDELYVPPDGKPSGEADRVAVFANGPGSLAARLQALVAAEVEAHSTEIGLPAAAT